MKSNSIITLLFTALVLFSCNNSKKEEKALTVSEVNDETEKNVNALVYTIDTNTSTTTYIGSKPTGKHNGQVRISKGFFEVVNNEITGGNVLLNMKSISVDDLGDGQEALGKSVLIDHLKSNDFLDVENHPTGEFTITSVISYQKEVLTHTKKEFNSKFKPLSVQQNIVTNPTHKMTGNLKLRGISKSISFPVRIEKYNSKIRMEAKFNIDRTDWNIKYGEEASVTDKIKDKFIYNTVNLGFNVEATSLSGSSHDPSLAPKVIDVFEKKFGIHEGKRRNHISGFCFSGYLTIKDQDIKKYSTSKIFSNKPLKVIGRFSHKGGVKKDESTPGEYGMAFEVTLEDGSTQNFSMNTLDFFPVKSPEGFHQLMLAKVSGKPEGFEKLKQDHPEFKNFKLHYKNKPKELKNFTNHQFNSVNSFYLENQKGITIPVRWSFVPRNEKITIDTSTKVDLFKETNDALHKTKTLTWDMVVTIANANDDVDDASSPWTGEHQQVTAAVLTVHEISKEGSCNTKNFDPLQLQRGFLPSDDPILKFRSPAYAAAFVRRLQEAKNKNN